MPGQQERPDGRERPGQPDPSGSGLVSAELPADARDRPNGRGHLSDTGAREDSPSRNPGGESTGRHGSARSVFEPAPPADDGQAQVGLAAEPALPQRAAAQDELPTSQAPQAAPPPRRTAPAGAQAGNPKPGSWADLRQRLERLPYGHPSSPYHVDGEPKPPPPRLKHLELAPPGREASPTPRRHEFSEAGTAERAPSEHRTAGAISGDDAKPSAPVSQRLSSPRLTDRNGQHQPSAPFPSSGYPAPETEPYPSSAGRTAAGQPPMPAAPPRTAADRPRTLGEPPRTPAERPRIPAELPVGTPRRPDPLTAAQGPASGRPPPATELSSASTKARSLPVGRGPGFNASSSRPQLASDGSWTWGPARLTPEQVRIALDGYERFRMAEGRDLFGAYGTSGLTAKLRQVEELLEHGTLAPQTEDHALLEIDVFRARFADMLRRHPDRSPELLASRVPGALCYAFVFGADHYADGILLVQDALEARGFELQARKNSWNSVANRCVFTMWHDPLSELPFEVQFHTSASLDAQQLARTSAGLINDPRVPPEEAASLRSDLASAWAALPSPPGSAQIGDYRRYGSRAPR
jgi:hypothetical protein